MTRRAVIVVLGALVILALWMGQAWQDEKRRADCLQEAIETDSAVLAHDCAR